MSLRSKVLIDDYVKMSVLKKLVERSSYYESLGFKELAYIGSVPLKSALKSDK